MRVIAFVSDRKLRSSLQYLHFNELDNVRFCYDFMSAHREVAINGCDCLVITQVNGHSDSYPQGHPQARNGLHFAMHLIDSVPKSYWPKQVLAVNVDDTVFAHIQAVLGEARIPVVRVEIAL